MADNNSTFNSSTNGTFNGTFNGTNGEFTPPAPGNFWIGLLWPILYITILVGSLSTFSSLYRKRQIAKAARLESWFPPHKARDLYLSLLHMDPSEGASEDEKKLKQVPDNVLKAALLKRAVEDIQRIVQLRTGKPALQTLLQRGSVGDELWQRYLRAEKEMEEEVKDVVNEANAFAPDWGQIIFQSANEINQNRLLKERIAELQATTQAEKDWWEKRRTGIQANFMKELDEDEAAEAQAAEAAVAKAQAQQGSSDEDAPVIVEAGGPGSAQGGLRGKKKGAKK
ncbi:Putative translocation protein Sec66 [Septoria linicola]|uniref:Translocation protein Sec66 n=1 Tax=Septoria linicola TaxID=215465 RepID=A0A9Q9AS26_9PEZI|nr:putative translocation protein Sec66 [Septoria linicola]USW54080.1 Putative translocation protein Sec66 [Septoria linicola]